MTFQSLISKILVSRRRMAILDKLIEAGLTCCGIAIAFLLVETVSKTAAAIVLFFGFCLFFLLLFRRRWFFLPQFDDTCLLIDEQLDLKSRAVSLMYAQTSSSEARSAICAIIENQLAQVSISDEQISSLREPTPWVKISWLGVGIGLILLIIALRQPGAINEESRLAAQNLEQFIFENQGLPPQATEKLSELANTIRSSGLGSDIVEQKITETLSALDDSAKNGDNDGPSLTTKNAEGAPEGIPNSITIPTPTPTSTPTPTPQQISSGISDVDIQNGDQKKGGNAERKKNDGPQRENSNLNPEKKTSDERGKSQHDEANEAESKDSTQNGDEQAKNDGSKNGQEQRDQEAGRQKSDEPSSSGKGDSQQQKQSEGSSSGSGQQGQQPGGQQQGQQGSDGGAQTGGQEGKGEQAGPQGSLAKDGQRAQQKGGAQQGSGGQGDADLDGQTSQQGQGKGQGGTGNPLHEAKDKVASLSKKKDDTGGNGTGKDSAAQGGARADEKKGGGGNNGKTNGASDERENAKSTQKSDEGNASQGGEGKDKSDSPELVGMNEGESDGKSSKDTRGNSASLGNGSEDPNMGEGDGKGMSGPKGFVDAPVQEEPNENLDPRWGKNTGKVAEHNDPTNFKRSLSKIPLAKPETVVTRKDQPIPLEYQGILGAD